MGLVPVGVRLKRRIASNTGLNVIHATGNGGHVFNFTTDDHRHGSWDRRTGRWSLMADCPGYTSCRQLFGGGAR